MKVPIPLVLRRSVQSAALPSSFRRIACKARVSLIFPSFVNYCFAMNLRKFQPLSLAMLLAPLSLSSGCDDDSGEVTVTVWGESVIEDKLPASEVADGWEVKFQSFEVELSNVMIAGQPLGLSKPLIAVTTPSTSEVKGERGQEIGRMMVPEGDYNHAAFTVVKTSLSGTATKDGVQKQFNWVFETPVRYTHCEAMTRTKAGVLSNFEITLHADHYLYDSLAAHKEPQLYFGPIAAADSNNDGMVTKEELLLAPVDPRFDTGSQKVSNLWTWLEAQHRTVAHSDGEFHCKAHAGV